MDNFRRESGGEMATYIMVSYQAHQINSRVRELLSLVRQCGEGTLVSSGKDSSKPGYISVKPYPNPTGMLRIIGLQGIKGMLDRHLFFPSPHILYVRRVVNRLKRFIDSDIRAGKHVVLITCVPHHEIALAGLYLKKKFPELKWIIDWQDLWSYDENYYERIPPIYRKKLLETERRILETADINVTTNDHARKILIDKFGVSSERAVAINHHFLQEEFDSREMPKKKETAIGRKEAIKIGILGNVFKPPRVPGMKLINVLRSVRERGSNLELHIFGDTSAEGRKARLGNKEPWLIFHDRVSHKDSLSGGITECDFLLLLLADLPNCKVVLPQKLPHYFKIGKPILAIVPEDSAVAQAIRETGTGYVIPSADDWVSTLEEIFQDCRNDRIRMDRREEGIEAYSWENISKNWQRLISGV